MKCFKFLGFMACWLIWTTASVFAASFQPESMTAQAQILIEAHTGKIIYEKNAESKLYPASTTKMMTLLVALEAGNLDDTVTVGARAAGAEGSSMELAVGDQVKLRELLYGIMLASGNDATIAVAEHLAGSVEEYARRMTEKAWQIGAFDTHFVNSSGLPDPDHYSTAHDLARIAAYGYRIPIFREIVETKEREVEWIAPEKRHFLKNTNELLGKYQGSNGMKTGYTEAAGECLVASAERDGVNLIAVVMHADEDRRWDEAAALLDYGFQEVRMETAYDRHDLVQSVRVRGGEAHQVTARPERSIRYPVSGNDKARFSIKANVPDFIEAPVQVGQELGTMQILYDNQVVDRVALRADADVKTGFNLFSLILSWYDSILLAFKQFSIF